MAILASNMNVQIQHYWLRKKILTLLSFALQERKGERLPIHRVLTQLIILAGKNNARGKPEFQPLFNLNKGFNYGFSATIPILNGLNTKRLIKQARLEFDYQQALI